MERVRAWARRLAWLMALLVVGIQMAAPDARPDVVLAGDIAVTITAWLCYRTVRWLYATSEFASPTVQKAVTRKPAMMRAGVSTPGWRKAERSLEELVTRVQELSLRPDIGYRYPGLLDIEHASSRAFLDFYDEALVRHFRGDRAEEVLFVRAVDEARRMFGVARREAQARAASGTQR